MGIDSFRRDKPCRYHKDTHGYRPAGDGSVVVASLSTTPRGRDEVYSLSALFGVILEPSSRLPPLQREQPMASRGRSWRATPTLPRAPSPRGRPGSVSLAGFPQVDDQRVVPLSYGLYIFVQC